MTSGITNKRNIFLFYTYRICSRLYFHLAVLFVYFYLNKIDFLSIQLLLALYGITLMVSSQWKHKLFASMSEKQILLLGEFIKAMGLVFFTLEATMVNLIAAQILSGIGYSLTAGTDSKLLKNILSAKDQHVYKAIESSSNSYMFLSFLFAGIVGSILFTFNPYYVFYGSILATIVCFISVASLKIYQQENKQAVKQNVQQHETKANQFDKFWIHYYAVSRAFPLAIFVGFLPYFLFVTVDINLYFFGVVLSLFTFSGSLAARFLVRLNKKYGYKRIMSATVLLTIVSMILLSIVSNVWLSIVVVTLLGFASGGVRPLAVSTLSTENSSTKQAYLFASMEKLYGFWNAALLIIGGILFDRLGFNGVMVLFTILFGLLILFFSKKYHFENKNRTLNNVEM